MKLRIFPSSIEGVIEAPASKSAAQRLLLMSLSKQHIHLTGLGNDEDSQSMFRVIQQLPMDLKMEDKSLEMSSLWHPQKTDLGQWKEYLEVNVGESGFALRTLMFILPLYASKVVIHKNKSLRERDFEEIDGLIHSFGWDIHHDTSKITIESHLDFTSFLTLKEWPLLDSSQYLTGYLIALALLLDWKIVELDDLSFSVEVLKSKPYILQTIELLEATGHYYPVLNDEGSITYRAPKTQPSKWEVDKDWSGAALIMSAAIATRSSVIIKGLDLFKHQADKKILEALQDMGIHTSIRVDEIEIRFTSRKNAFQLDAKDCPDLFPALFVMAVQCSGTSVIHGVSRLRNKESDRAQALLEVAEILGINAFIQEDMLIIEGGALDFGILDSFGDHRMAMAISVLGMISQKGLELSGADVIEKSFPDFYKELSEKGMSFKEI